MLSPAQRIVRSIFITSLVAAIPAVLFISHWVSVFIAVVVAQFVVFYIANSIIQTIKARSAAALAAELAKQYAVVSCPCTKKVKEVVQIDLEDPSPSYNCHECNKRVALAVTIETRMLTDHIDVNKSYDNTIAKFNELARINALMHNEGTDNNTVHAPSITSDVNIIEILPDISSDISQVTDNGVEGIR